MSEEAPQVRIEYIALQSVQPATRNPKRHNISELVNSIKRFGFVQPVAMNEESGRLVAGHGRLEALLVMKEAGEAAPARVVEKNGEWYVPVLRGVSFNNESEAEAFLVADNRLVEVGGWNEVEVARILQGLGDLSGVGFSVVDLEALFNELQLDKLLAAEETKVGKTSDGDGERAEDQSAEIRENFQIVITCVDESEQSTLLQRFMDEGLKCRALI